MHYSIGKSSYEENSDEIGSQAFRLSAVLSPIQEQVRFLLIIHSDEIYYYFATRDRVDKLFI